MPKNRLRKKPAVYPAPAAVININPRLSAFAGKLSRKGAKAQT